jgi:hypothetical protein
VGGTSEETLTTCEFSSAEATHDGQSIKSGVGDNTFSGKFWSKHQPYRRHPHL